MPHRSPARDACAAPRLLCCGAAMLLIAGCASGARAPAVRSTVSLEPLPTVSAPLAADTALPALAMPQVADADATERRIQQLDMVDQDLRAVLRGMAESYGLDYQIDPSVQGRVTTRLSDVTLRQALDALVLPHGYQYQLQGNVLRVVPQRLQTQIFTLDYVALSRAGIGTTVIQRRLGNGGTTGGNFGGQGGGGFGAQAGGGFGGQGGGGFGAAGIGGGDVIQSVSAVDLWNEIRVALEGLVFDFVATAPGGGAAGAIPGAAAQAGAPGQQGNQMGTGSTPYSRVGEDGRRLIINPVAGTIVVSAPPEKLAEVQNFITTIERSVQRQVLIEAKIVEVSLNQQFEFGIDWSVVRRVGNVNLQVGAGSGGAQFRLADGGDPEGTINVVLRALEEQGDVSVLSSPRVSVLNNQRAAFAVTTEQVFFSVTRQPILGPTGGTIGFNTQVEPQQISVGITLDVVAQIAPDNAITMNVRPVITDVIAEKSIALDDGTQATAPVIDRRETDTMVRVRGGETVVIGGLMQTRQSNRSTGVPGLRSIPGLGRLFGGVTTETQKRELVIFITPRIIAGTAPSAD